MRPKMSKCVLSLVLICTSVFIVGVVLLILGFISYMSEPAPIPYIYSMTLCQTSEETEGYKVWSVYDVEDGKVCPSGGVPKNQAQGVLVPKGVLGESVPYDIVVYTTNKVIGKQFQLIFYENKDQDYFTVETSNKPLSSYPSTDFAVCGGRQLNIYRDGPLNEDDGDYIEGNCQNVTSGCIYEPARSLTSYDLSEYKPIHLTNIPEGGSKFTVQAELQIPTTSEGSNNKEFIPELYVEFKVGGRGPEQDKGLILLIIGGVFADIMPATLYFLLQKYHFKKEKNFDDHSSGIPLMEMDQ